MKLLLIQPAVTGAMLGGVSRSGRASMPAIGLPTIAALTPEDFDVELIEMRTAKEQYAKGIEFTTPSEYLERLGDRISLEETPDLVGVSALTAQAPLAYRITDHFRDRGIPVAIGGYHASMLPDEAGKHADAVVVGEGELVWPQLIDDFRQGKLGGVYKADRLCDLDQDVPTPRRDLLDPERYTMFNVLQATRGCLHACDFCSVHAYFGRSYRTRDPQAVAQELRGMMEHSAANAGSFWGRMKHGFEAWLGRHDVFFADDNLVFDRRYAKTLCDAIKDVGIKWSCQASLPMAYDEDLLAKASASGCTWVLLGLESLHPGSLESLRKNVGLKSGKLPESVEEMAEALAEAVSNFHRHGINVVGNFVFGFDHDTPDTLARTIDASLRIGIDNCLYHASTPFPGTPLYDRVRTEQRITSTDWANYNLVRIVAMPQGLTVDELASTLRTAYRRFYTWRRMIGRTFRSPRGCGSRAIANYSQWRKARRLYFDSSHALGTGPEVEAE